MQHPKVISFHVWQKNRGCHSTSKETQNFRTMDLCNTKSTSIEPSFPHRPRLSEVIFDFKSFCLGFACWLTIFASSLCKYTQVTKIGKWSQKLSENHEILQVSRQKSLPHLSRSSMGWCLSHPNVSDFTKAPLFKRSMGCDAWAFFCLEKWR